MQNGDNFISIGFRIWFRLVRVGTCGWGVVSLWFTSAGGSMWRAAGLRQFTRITRCRRETPPNWNVDHPHLSPEGLHIGPPWLHPRKGQSSPRLTIRAFPAAAAAPGRRPRPIRHVAYLLKCMEVRKTSAYAALSESEGRCAIAEWGVHRIACKQQAPGKRSADADES
jgi:hypothetical protein